RPRSARPRGAEGRYARHLPHGRIGLHLPSGGTGGVRAIGRVALRLLDPERSTAGVSGHRSARRSGGTEGQLPPVRERRSNGLDRSAWRISRLDRCPSRSTHALRCSLNFRVGSLSGSPCLRSGWPRCVASPGPQVEVPNLPGQTPEDLNGYLARTDSGSAAELGSPSNGGGPFPAV